MSRFNTLYNGQSQDAADELESRYEITTDDLRIALINALRKIDSLEHQIRRTNDAINMIGREP